MRLTRLVIRVLPEDHDAHRLRRREFQRGKHALARRVDRVRLRVVVRVLQRRADRVLRQQRVPSVSDHEITSFAYGIIT